MQVGQRLTMEVPLGAHAAAPPVDQLTGAMLSWRQQARKKLAAMERLIAQGKGNTLVDGGGCTEPGGGIQPTKRTATQVAAQMRAILNGGPWVPQQAGASPPTSPPPFGRPAGHIGGSYDWWWWNFGRPSGMPYEPKVKPHYRLSCPSCGTTIDECQCMHGGPKEQRYALCTNCARGALAHQTGSLSSWAAGETMAPVAKAVAPVAVPAAALVVARLLGASWPMALVTACAVIPIVWYVTHQGSFGQQTVGR